MPWQKRMLNSEIYQFNRTKWSQNLKEESPQMVEALERAADAGLTSVTAEEVRNLKSKLDAALMQNEAEQAANKALEEERQRLRDIADRLRGLLDARDGRLGELEEQLERVMQGPRSVSAEHDYLVEQIEELGFNLPSFALPANRRTS